MEYTGPEFFNGKKIATSYPVILKKWLNENNVTADIHVITGSVEIAPGIGLADAIFDIVSSGSTLISNRLKEVEVVIQSEAVLVANPNLSAEKQEILDEFIFRMESVLSLAKSCMPQFRKSRHSAQLFSGLPACTEIPCLYQTF